VFFKRKSVNKGKMCHDKGKIPSDKGEKKEKKWMAGMDRAKNQLGGSLNKGRGDL